MTIATGTLVTAQATGLREDLSDMIYNVDPTETPFISSIAERTDATAVTH